jgi:hypothetical protein
MQIDILLALAAAAVAIVGTLSNPDQTIKRILVGFAVVIGCLTVFKSVKDDEEKRFLQRLVV